MTGGKLWTKTDTDLCWQILEDELQLIGRNTSRVIFAEHSETFLERQSSSYHHDDIPRHLVLILQVCLRVLLHQDLAELGEVDEPAPVVNLVDHFIHFDLSKVQCQN